jgi:hypothetical protein
VHREAAADEHEESTFVPSAGTPPVISSREEIAVVELEGTREKSASVPSVAVWGAAPDKHEAKPSSSRRSRAPTALACSAQLVCTRCSSLRVVHYHHMGQSKYRRPFVPSWACLAWFMVQVDARYGMSKRDKS